MEEKIIIKSKLYSSKKILIGILIVGLIAAILAFFIGSASWKKSYNYDFGGIFREEIQAMGLFEFAFSHWNNNFYKGLFIGILAGFVVIGLIFYFWSSKIKMTVTNKRVYGNAAFGKRVDLPLDSISAIGISAFKGIAVGTSSGKIKFALIKNRDDIHKAISDLLIERQNSSNKQAIKPAFQPAPTNFVNIPAVAVNGTSGTEEIKKYKELLDNGIITQEEFDAKKKQLLGL